MESTDVLFDLDNETIRIENGDFVVGKSDQQHVQHLLKAEPGQYYHAPTLGIGINNQLNASLDANEISQQIRVGLEADNYNVREIVVTDDFEVSIDAEKIS